MQVLTTACMMTVLELQVLELRCPGVQSGSVHIQTSIYEPSYRSRHSKHKTAPRGWLDGFKWEDHIQTHSVRSLDARLLVRVIATGGRLPLRRSRCIGMVALRLSTIRAMCQAATQATSDQVAGELTEPPLLASRKGSCPLASWMCCCQRRIIWRLLAARLRKQMQRQAHTASNTATIGTV